MNPRNRRPLTLAPSTANLAINTCAGVIDPSGGPAVAMPPAWNRQRQIVGLWNNAATFVAQGHAAAAADFLASADPRVLDDATDLLSVEAQAPTWWCFDVFGIEVAEQRAIGLPPVAPIQQGMLINIGQRFCRLKLRVQWENMQVARTVDVDIGTGTRFSLTGNNVRIMLAFPRGNRFLEVGSRLVDTTYQSGQIVNALIGASGYPGFSPLSNRYPTFSQNVVQLGAAEFGVEAPLRLPVPPAAKYVTIYTSELVGAVPTPWVWESIPTGALAPVVLNYDTVTNTIVRAAVPQGAAAIVMPIAIGARRRWQIVWELEL